MFAHLQSVLFVVDPAAAEKLFAAGPVPVKNITSIIFQ